MWPIPRVSNNHITILFEPEHITCAIIQPHTTSAPYKLKSFQTFACNNGEVTPKGIGNLTSLQHTILSFVQQNNIKKPQLHIVLARNPLLNSLVTTPKSKPQPEDFEIPNLSCSVWTQRYLYATDNGMFCFYVTGIARERLLQYQLLAINCRLPLASVTTKHMAQLHTYQFVYGAAFRHSQLGIDLVKHSNSLESVFTPSILARIVHIDPTFNFNAHTIRAIVPHLGAYIGATNEAH